MVYMEPVIPLSVVCSVISGIATAYLTFENRFRSADRRNSSRVDTLKGRLDTIELRLAKEYADKEDLSAMFNRLDERMDRLDYKLDQILIGYNKADK